MDEQPPGRIMEKFYQRIAFAYFVVATVLLIALAFVLLAIAVTEAVSSIWEEDRVEVVLSAISLLVIGFAVVETAKFIAEEEIMRRRELRSSTESRRSITKFITIIVIAASLEALVMVFQATREGIQYSIFPASLFLASMFALVALGAYQWLSSRIKKDDD
jgi:multidrug transporter EmrE-like cation transporter